MYKAGTENPADYLSRHPVKIDLKEQSNIAEDYVNFLAHAAVPTTLKVDSHMLRHPAARHDAVRHDAAKTHGSCSHIQRVPL